MDLVKNFNEKYPVGSTVMWRSVSHEAYPHLQYEVREPAIWMNGQAVCWLKGKAGCVSIEPQFLDYGFSSPKLQSEFIR